jgi:hypothetical protein
VFAAQGNGGENVFFIARNYDTDRDLAIIGAVGCVESTASLIEANFSAKVTTKGGFKRGGIELHGMLRGWGSGLRHKAQNIFEDAGVVRKGIASCVLPTSPCGLLPADWMDHNHL